MWAEDHQYFLSSISITDLFSYFSVRPSILCKSKLAPIVPPRECYFYFCMLCIHHNFMFRLHFLLQRTHAEGQLSQVNVSELHFNFIVLSTLLMRKATSTDSFVRSFVHSYASPELKEVEIRFRSRYLYVSVPSVPYSKYFFLPFNPYYGVYCSVFRESSSSTNIFFFHATVWKGKSFFSK